MNIFEVLNNGKGSINEENVSSFLGYLLNPLSDHGMGSLFLGYFLKEINIDYHFIDLNNISIDFEVVVALENHKRYIDIVIDLDKYIIAIENKISEKSQQKNQLQEEYNGLKTKHSTDDKKIIMCYLTLTNVEDKIKDKLLRTEDDDKKYFLTWNEHIIKIFEEIFQNEMEGIINPINNEYLKYTLKMFIHFIRNLNNSSKYFNYKENQYKITRYDSGKTELAIKTKDSKEDYWENISARPLLREYLKSIHNYTESETDKNTQYLGYIVWKLLPPKQ